MAIFSQVIKEDPAEDHFFEEGGSKGCDRSFDETGKAAQFHAGTEVVKKVPAGKQEGRDHDTETGKGISYPESFVKDRKKQRADRDPGNGSADIGSCEERTGPYCDQSRCEKSDDHKKDLKQNGVFLA